MAELTTTLSAERASTSLSPCPDLAGSLLGVLEVGMPTGQRVVLLPLPVVLWIVVRQALEEFPSVEEGHGGAARYR